MRLEPEGLHFLFRPYRAYNRIIQITSMMRRYSLLPALVDAVRETTATNDDDSQAHNPDVSSTAMRNHISAGVEGR